MSEQIPEDIEMEKQMEKEKEKQEKEIEKQFEALWLLYVGLFAFIKKEIFNTYSKTPNWDWQEVNKFKRLDKLNKSISDKINEFKREENKVFRKFLSSNFTNFYNSTMLLLGANPKGFKKLTPDQIRKELDFPWSGMTFSERIWKNQEQLKQRLKEGLIQSAVNNESMFQLTKRIEKEMNTSYGTAKRLVITENARVQYLADMKVYEEEGVKKVRYNATFDKTTCSHCASNHGREYVLGEQPSLPRHAHCKCFYTPVE